MCLFFSAPFTACTQCLQALPKGSLHSWGAKARQGRMGRRTRGALPLRCSVTLRSCSLRAASSSSPPTRTAARAAAFPAHPFGQGGRTAARPAPPRLCAPGNRRRALVALHQRAGGCTTGAPDHHRHAPAALHQRAGGCTTGAPDHHRRAPAALHQRTGGAGVFFRESQISFFIFLRKVPPKMRARHPYVGG